MSGLACISYFYAPAADVLRLKRRRTSHPNGAASAAPLGVGAKLRAAGAIAQTPY